MTCQQCHWDNELNDAGGKLSLEGVPDTYTPGEQYLITVTLTRPGVRRAGFQMSAREDGINMNSGNDAGFLRPVDAAVATAQDEKKRVTYAQHSATGSKIPTPGMATWTVSWTAPDQGPVVFHVAANASNADDSPLGDYIYTAVGRSGAP